MSSDIIKSDVITSPTTSLAGILEKYSEILTLTSTNRIQCRLTGHEMPPVVGVVNQYLNSNKFKKAHD
jgi:hypothetical protein